MNIGSDLRYQQKLSEIHEAISLLDIKHHSLARRLLTDKLQVCKCNLWSKRIKEYEKLLNWHKAKFQIAAV